MPRRKTRPRASAKPETKQAARWPAWAGMGAVLSALVALQLYLILSVLPPNTFYSGDCGTKLLQTQSLAMQHWTKLSVVYPGRELDPQLHFVATGMLQVRKGQVWGVHSLLFALLASFTYAWFGYRGLYVVPALSLVGALFLFWLLARRTYRPGWALLSLGLAAFATPLLFYGVEFWEHTLAVLLAMAGLLLVARQVREGGPWWWSAAGGAFAAAALAVRPEGAVLLLAIVIGLAVTVRPGRTLARTGGLFAAGAAAVLAPLAVVNQLLFGDPLGTVLGLHLHGGHPDPRLLVITKLLMPFSAGMALRLAAAVLAALLLWWLAARESRGARGGVTRALGLAAAAVVVALAVVEGRRLLGLWRQPAEVTSLAESFPLFWALPLAAVGWSSQAEVPARRTSCFLAAAAGCYLVGVLVTSPTWAGAQWGPRLLLLVMPVLALLVARPRNLRLGSGRVALLAVCLLGLASIGVQASGLRWMARVKSMYVNTVQLFERETAPGDVLVSEEFWFHEILAPLYYQRRFFYLSSPDLMGELVGRLRASGVPYFYYLLPRGADSKASPEELNDDLLAEAEKHNLLHHGLRADRWAVIYDRPYYLLRLNTGLGGEPSG